MYKCTCMCERFKAKSERTNLYVSRATFSHNYDIGNLSFFFLLEEPQKHADWTTSDRGWNTIQLHVRVDYGFLPICCILRIWHRGRCLFCATAFHADSNSIVINVESPQTHVSQSFQQRAVDMRTSIALILAMFMCVCVAFKCYSC